ncbi:MAG: 5-formyltetrahydrofolate cyclo-ligase [Nocardioides sp.]|uniref:5-formyltetrahydrofolate cyclo-ligase n=1 Tax=Nocardioides sp. TaxID=35761 RepID=UPI0039E21E95
MPDSQPSPDPQTTARYAKAAQRDQLLTARGRRDLAGIGEASRALAAVLTDAIEVRRAATVAAYVSVGSEPGTGDLLDALASSGRRVILPRLLPDDDLDWSVYDGRLERAARGLLEPPGPLLGVDAIATADAVLVPGLAVDPTGARLGRGGGSYDRALARVPRGTFTCVLLYPDEVGIAVPVEAHDRRVSAAASSVGIVRFG